MASYVRPEYGALVGVESAHDADNLAVAHHALNAMMRIRKPFEFLQEHLRVFEHFASLCFHGGFSQVIVEKTPVTGANMIFLAGLPLFCKFSGQNQVSVSAISKKISA